MYIINYITASLSAPSRQTHDWLYAEFHRRRSACPLYRWMDASGGTPFLQAYLIAQTHNFKPERSDGLRVLTLCTQRISNLPCSLHLKISDFKCTVYVINVSITDAFWPESRETLAQHKLSKYNMIYGKVFPHLANRSANMIQFLA